MKNSLAALLASLMVSGYVAAAPLDDSLKTGPMLRAWYGHGPIVNGQHLQPTVSEIRQREEEWALRYGTRLGTTRSSVSSTAGR